ncbi:MAG: HAD family phosphatase [Clostridia bacterium]|nr:HAD family phosphatase [Clostridia bacterium]
MLSGKKLIIFDLDGTLINSVGIWNEVDRRFLKSFGVDPLGIDVQAQRDSKLREFKSSDSPYRDYCAFLGKKYNSPLSPDELVTLRYKIADDLVTNDVCYKPYADVFIKELKKRGFTLAIASTTLRSNLDVYLTKNKNIIERAPLDSIFDLILTREDASEMKPSPEIFNRAIRHFGLNDSECLIFEDSLVGVEAANAAGVDVIAMYDEHSDCDREEINNRALLHFENYKELMEMLKWEF